MVIRVDACAVRVADQADSKRGRRHVGSCGQQRQGGCAIRAWEQVSSIPVIAISRREKRIVKAILLVASRRPRGVDRLNARIDGPGRHTKANAVAKAKPVHVAIRVATAWTPAIEQDGVTGVEYAVLLAAHLNANLLPLLEKLKCARIDALHG